MLMSDLFAKSLVYISSEFLYLFCTYSRVLCKYSTHGDVPLNGCDNAEVT